MRKGALSDEAVKRKCPHFFPLDLDSSIAMHNVTFIDSRLSGVKVPRYLRTHKEIPRYPAADMANHAQFGVLDHERAYDEAKAAYAQQLAPPASASATPSATSAAASSTTESTQLAPDPSALSTYHPSTILHLGRLTRSEGTRAFDQATNNAWKKVLTAKSRAFLANIGVEEGLNALFGTTNVPAHAARMSHEQVLATLNREFRDSPADMAILHRVERSAQHHNVVPSQEGFVSQYYNLEEPGQMATRSQTRNEE